MVTDPDVPPTLAQVVSVAENLAAGCGDDLDDCLDVILAGLRHRLGFDVTFVGEFVEGGRLVRAVSTDVEPTALPAGQVDPMEETYCARVADGRLPEYVRDARSVPGVRDLAVTAELPVGTYLSVPVRFSDGTVFGTLCGLTCVPDPAIQARELGVMRLVARLLARHLEAGRLGDEEQARARADVEHVIASGGPDVVFQPVRDLSSLDVVGYEALARFDGQLPEAWFAQAALVGLVVPLEVAAVEQALAHLPGLPAGAHVAVNASAAALCSPELADVLGEVDLSKVVVELTEQTGVPDYDVLRERVDLLRRRGGRLAVDDAGAGYAGLQRIIELAPDVIKLDRALVHDVADDPARQAMVSALSWFARRTGADLVAEGIESVAEVSVLRELGVPLGQGFHLGRPAPLPATG